MNLYMLAYIEFRRWNSDYAFLWMHYYRNCVQKNWGW